MHTLNEEVRLVGDSAYWGEYGDWYIFLATHRDADTVSRSNWQVAQNRLKRCKSWTIERFSHWAVGWVDYLLVKPGGKAEKLANQMLLELENYPVLDDEHLSSLEWNEATEYWQRMSLKERVELCAKHEVNIFAARRDIIPDTTNGDIFYALME